MQPEILPLRIVFVPHWKYLDTAKTFRLHVPTGYTSAMFTHLPSRTVSSTPTATSTTIPSATGWLMNSDT
jgi:hypothetical protein